jgi:uncharacterized protein (DUF362 family)
MKEKLLNRRNFIRLALLGGIGAGAAYIQHQTAQVGLLNYLRWSIRGQLERFKPPAVVGLASADTYETLGSTIADLWKIAEMPDLSGKRVLVKPNLLDQVENELATTHPKVVGAVVDLLISLGVRQVVVGDGSAFQRDTTSVARRCGLLDELASRSIPFYDLNYEELVAVAVRDGWIRNTDTLWMPSRVTDADYIVSLPKLKTHHWAGVTLSLKNLLGLIPGSRYGWPKNIIHMNGINPTIIGLYEALPPVLALVDGIIGMEGNGPLAGKPVQHGLLAAGRDPLAVDITCAQLMGFAIDSIPYLAGGAAAGIGQAMRIETRGISPIQLQRHYQPAPQE